MGGLPWLSPDLSIQPRAGRTIHRTEMLSARLRVDRSTPTLARQDQVCRPWYQRAFMTTQTAIVMICNTRIQEQGVSKDNRGEWITQNMTIIDLYLSGNIQREIRVLESLRDCDPVSRVER